MWTQSILILLQCLKLAYVFCDGTYECGDHGRFEYCIDEIPGCIIGCHCHPGYYFDTDTKICEPNSKLIEHHRRPYVAEPTRLQSHIMSSSQNFVTSSVATTSKIDGAIDEISKDTEDLGDWLYNQFFKTIENQVINSTNDQNTLTRRSASSKSIKRPQRRKKTKKRRKNKHKVKEKKLSQITENDSVFDISSSSNSDSSDSSGSSSDSSLDYDRYYNHHADDDEHGHKKIVMIKKKPKQNLPNFIFLPNLDTPFYPPVGLPPPQIPVPMYPMVPIPPMVPFIHIEEIRTTAAPDKTTTETVEIKTTEQTLPTRISTEQENDQIITKIPEQIGKKEPEKLRHLNKMRSKEPKHSKSDKTEKNLRSIKMMSPSRQKFIQRLKQKMQNQSAKSLMPPWMRNKNTVSNSFSKQDDNHEHPYLENSPDSYMINDIKPNTREDGAAISENVDFKYITELIHRDDLNNNSNKLPPIEYNPFDSIEIYQSPIQKEKNADYIIPPNALDNRRFIRPNYRKSDESYYMNLGRQIASMIRSIDTQNKELNIKVEATHDIPKNDLFVKVSSPRSYWERSVRSPLTFLNSNKRNVEYLKRSNELLFDIENKVEIIASTVPTLTLREIENIVSVMETAKRRMKDNETTVKDVLLAENNLNINLWPQALSNARNRIKNSISANLKNHIKLPIPSPTSNNSQNKKKNIPDHLNGFSMAITNTFSAQQNPQGAEKSNFNTQIMETKSYIKPASYPNIENYNQGPQKTLPNPKYIKSTFSGQNFRQPLWDHEINPFFLKNRKYFDNTHNYFVNRNENFPSIAPKNRLQNSYFHHEISNFDYIE
ncbi:uncharacterized protein LOC126771553 [Nymphalis io]|uniref:uncharacterized protein LOC126771553 n=1 Tax=Inachis io TaxID=171585 RepID=UPI00216AAF5A|nr:uncharacterized protein LOC126771553 [Nymphalis io]